MYYGEIKNCDIANGEGVRVTLFVSGCRNHCPNCFQPQTWAFDYGRPFTEETQAQLLAMLEPDYISGLTLLGGDPFEEENQAALLPFLKRVRAKFGNGKTIWAFSGYTYDELTGATDAEGATSHAFTPITEEMLGLIDVLVDGRFVEKLKNISLRFRGSENQRLIDLNATREAGRVVLLPNQDRA